MRFLSIVVLTFWGLAAIAQQADVKDKIMAAMADDIRSESEVERDRNRKPVETMEFFGLKDDMRVLELMPGGGWYTKILAPVLRENGELYVGVNTDSVRDKLLTQDGFDHVKVLEIDAEQERVGPGFTRSITAFEFSEGDFDMAVTFRNMHNFTPAGRRNLNAAVFKALKSGGLLGVVDHTKRHMELINMENRRRADPVEIILELADTGFEFVGYTDLHYRADDELRYEVGRKTVTGNTDRFTLLFRKP